MVHSPMGVAQAQVAALEHLVVQVAVHTDTPILMPTAALTRIMTVLWISFHDPVYA